MTEGQREVDRVADAADARALARILLAAGISPETRRDGAEHVLLVAEADAARAALALGRDPDGLSAIGPGATDALDVAAGRSIAADDASSAVPEEPAIEEEDGYEIDERGFVVVAVESRQDDARRLAASLVEHGIGAELCSAFETGHANPMTDAEGVTAVQVLEHDADRASVLLEREPPPRLAAPARPSGAGDGDGDGDGDAKTDSRDEAALDEADTTGRTTAAGDTGGLATGGRRRSKPGPEVHDYLGGRLQLTQRQAVTMIVGYGLALVLIPLGFFLMVRWTLDPGGPDPSDTVTSINSVIESP